MSVFLQLELPYWVVFVDVELEGGSGVVELEDEVVLEVAVGIGDSVTDEKSPVEREGASKGDTLLEAWDAEVETDWDASVTLVEGCEVGEGAIAFVSYETLASKSVTCILLLFPIKQRLKPRKPGRRGTAWPLRGPEGCGVGTEAL